MKTLTNIRLLPILLSTALTTSFLGNTHSSSCAADFMSEADNQEYREYRENIPHPNPIGVNYHALNPGDLNRVRPFLYLADPAGSGQPEELAELSGLLNYNTYPFAMPSDTVSENTLYFTNSGPSEASNAGLLPLIQRDITQFIIEDFPDLSSLAGLANVQDGVDIQEPKKYKFHFFGRPLDANYGNIRDLADAWNRSDRVGGEITSPVLSHQCHSVSS